MSHWVNNIKTNQHPKGSIISGVEMIKTSTLILERHWTKHGGDNGL